MLPASIVDTVLFHHQVLLAEEPKLSVLTFAAAANIIVQTADAVHTAERLEFDEYLSLLDPELSLKQWEQEFRGQ